jgi:hypothetical protein
MAAKMLDTLAVRTLAVSPSIKLTLALVLFSFVMKWYFSLPLRPNFPEAELDERDWHGSLMRAKTKVS